jgi:hypothetical protein
MGFVTALVVKELGDDNWEVVKPLKYQGSSDLFVVPSGSPTDFASVPPIFRWLIPRSGRRTKAAVLHDYLWRPDPPKCSRSDADGIFRRTLHEANVPFLRRWLMWAAVRIVSLWKSRFSDGYPDIPRVLLVIFFPGAFVVAGGLVVLLLLLGFAALELLAGLPLMILRRFGMSSLKAVRRPSVLW